MSGDRWPGDHPGQCAVKVLMIQRRRHRPRSFPDDDDGVGAMTCESTARERARDEPHGIDGFYGRTKNVVEIGSKPLEGTAQ